MLKIAFLYAICKIHKKKKRLASLICESSKANRHIVCRLYLVYSSSQCLFVNQQDYLIIQIIINLLYKSANNNDKKNNVHILFIKSYSAETGNGEGG